MAEANRPTSVSQTIDDDECGSFIVVHRWSNDPAEVVGDKQQKLDKLDEHHQEQLDDSEEGDEQFSDAAADLGSSETLVSPNLMSIEDQRRQAGDVPSYGPESIEKTASTTEPPLSSLMASQDGAMMMQDDERFSMTNYSTTSSTSDQQELQELQAKLAQVISDHRGLYELLEKQNLELEQRKVTIEELKLLANESVLREKEKSEVSRKIVEKMTAERDLAIQELHTRIAATAVNASGFEALETLESQLKQREQILKQNDEQIKELSTRLHQEIIRREELAQLLQMKEDEDRIKRDSLSSSDEALARSLSERERMEQILEEAMKSKRELQQETVTLKDQLEIMTADNTRLQTLCEKLENRFAEGDTGNREMRIKLAALEAETERQIEINNQQISKTETLEEEKSTLLRELQGVTEMLQVRTTELREIREQTQQGGGHSSMTGSIAGNLLGGIGGLFKKPMKPTNATGARFYGMRDANDDPNEPFHDGGAQATHAISPGNQCPICLKRFDNLQKLEYHASNCGVDSATTTDPFVFP